MEYKLFRLNDPKPMDALELHVLACAYEAAWRALYKSEPVGRHIVESLGLAIDFGPHQRPAK
jgi:hypothetical protein